MSESGPCILVVDDEPSQRELLARVLRDRAGQILLAASGEEALEILAGRRADLVLLDMKMPGLGGLGTLREMGRRGLEVPVVVVTAFAEVEDAVEAMKAGARDYLRKPLDTAALAEIVARHAGGEPSPPAARDLPAGVVFASPLMEQVLAELAAVAPTEAAVLLAGESGTGKEVLAGLLHRWSPRGRGPFVTVNVASIPEALAESELFGHEKGAFTGAHQARPGPFELAAGGTLFLDEIGELPPAVQPKLLRALEGGRVRRLGAIRETAVAVRAVSATNRDLEAEVAAGRFRLDLFYRIAAFTVEIPPLRERPEEILPLARAFLAAGGGAARSLTDGAEACLQAHSWPGNIRELRNAVQRAAILAPGDWILPEHLPGAVRGDRPGRPAGWGPDPIPLEEIEKAAILEAVRRCGGNKSQAARELGISRRKLMYKLKEWAAG